MSCRSDFFNVDRVPFTSIKGYGKERRRCHSGYLERVVIITWRWSRVGKTNKIGLFYMVVNAIRCHGNAATWEYYLYVCVCKNVG
ncbi:hypothetical protein I7I53_04249 [Histoplasma capsulatum var. duboisii H88]|uniref:Uncharacterized protein n=1 Tax=Ajellomyces capsulatus (strain H88) TaxID=544711 RepID=A0A8A1LSJ8_AJEC8|nr:hypothetical protein I7I53_04249 [Histoplasma capsulatum var. duboisii H88]